MVKEEREFQQDAGAVMLLTRLDPVTFQRVRVSLIYAVRNCIAYQAKEVQEAEAIAQELASLEHHGTW